MDLVQVLSSSSARTEIFGESERCSLHAAAGQFVQTTSRFRLSLIVFYSCTPTLQLRVQSRQKFCVIVLFTVWAKRTLTAGTRMAGLRA
eukprot:3335850-Pleurochrysis_carterae.AAC.1